MLLGEAQFVVLSVLKLEVRCSLECFVLLVMAGNDAAGGKPCGVQPAQMESHSVSQSVRQSVSQSVSQSASQLVS